MRRFALVALLLSALPITACASRPDHYYRAATPSETANSDERQCLLDSRDAARSRTRQDANILQDRSSGPAYDSGGLFRSDLNINRHEQLAVDERNNVRDLTRACMADRGYRLLSDD